MEVPTSRDGVGKPPIEFASGVPGPWLFFQILHTRQINQPTGSAACLVFPEKLSMCIRIWLSQVGLRKHSALMVEGKNLKQTLVFGRKPQILGF